jgi:hypothetical protein
MQFALLLPNIPHTTDGRANTQSMLSFVPAADVRMPARHAWASLWTSVKSFVPFVH